jgi:hypothetical protein
VRSICSRACFGSAYADVVSDFFKESSGGGAAVFFLTGFFSLMGAFLAQFRVRISG